ncbi:MAG TPA: hypothetical protein VJ437_08945 [Acidiferrobacterales bacterium]|nr:hypothetical protein [Acidiferrobacterales bacterium]
MSTAEKIYLEVRRLPESLAQEVLEYVGYLEAKYGLRDLQSDALKAAQEPVMRHVWDNPEDDIWNEL